MCEQILTTLEAQGATPMLAGEIGVWSRALAVGYSRITTFPK